VRAVTPSVAVATFTAVAVLAGTLLLKALELIAPVGRFVERMRMRNRNLAVRMGLNRASGLAQALACLALAALFVFARVNQDVIGAWTSFFNSDALSALLPIGEVERARIYYEAVLDVAIPLFLYGLYRVVRLRRHEKNQGGIVALAVLVGVIAIMILMREWPYRTFHHRELERADLAGNQCYVSGESGAELLLLCPGSEPPRNHVVARDDPRLRRLGRVENVFRGIKVAAANP
jgi:hypothetical protein